MNGIDNTPMTGPQWATHHVAVWLENDGGLAEKAKDRARKPFDIKYGLSADALAGWVRDLIYGFDGHPSFDGLGFVRHEGGDPSAAQNVRDSFTREDFDGIDWSAVRESLLAE